MIPARGKIYYGLILSLVLAAILFGALAHASPASRYHYDFINVDINILPNGDLEITETQKFAYTSGNFHYGYRWIPTDKIEAINQVEIWEGEQRYEANSWVKTWIDIRKSVGGSVGRGTRAFTTWQDGDKLWIGWWFPKTPGGESRTFALKYLVKGGLRIYDTGDQLYWKAIFADRKVHIKSSTVTVHLPVAVAQEKLQIVTYGIPAEDKLIDERTIEFTTSEVPPRWELEIKVTFPHGLVKAKPPAWQASIDRQESDAGWLKIDTSTFRLIILFVGQMAFILGGVVENLARPWPRA